MIERAYGEYCDYTCEDYLAFASAVSDELNAEEPCDNEYDLRCKALLVEIERFVAVIENPPMQGLQKISDNADILTFYETTNSLHDGEVAFTDLCGDTLRVGVVVTSIIGRPIAQMIFRGVKEWQFRKGNYLFGSNIAFEDGGIIWADACRFDREVLDGSHYVRADSMEWFIG